MHGPYGSHIREQQVINHAIGFPEHTGTDHLLVLVSMPFCAKPMLAHQFITHFYAGKGSHIRACHHFHVFLPPFTHLQVGFIQIGVCAIGAHNPIALVAIAQGQGNHAFYKSIFRELLRFIQFDIARGEIHMKNRAQNELERTAFGTHHQINAAHIVFDLLLKLLVENQ